MGAPGTDLALHFIWDFQWLLAGLLGLVFMPHNTGSIIPIPEPPLSLTSTANNSSVQPSPL
jgi:hypothetical protein